jgi:hypothetical protein
MWPRAGEDREKRSVGIIKQLLNSYITYIDYTLRTYSISKPKYIKAKLLIINADTIFCTLKITRFSHRCCYIFSFVTSLIQYVKVSQ